MISLAVRYSIRAAAILTVVSVVAPNLHAQNECQCNTPGGESSRIASAIGGGLFAGLIAAAIPFRHAAALAAAPAGGAAPNALVVSADSSDVAPDGTAAPAQLASTSGAPLGSEPESGAASPGFAPAKAKAAPLPSITSSEATADGMIAPRTASLLPALGMIGVGALLLGIFFIRVRKPRLRSH